MFKVTNSKHFPQRLTRILWTSEQTVIIFLCTINWLARINKKRCIFCEVRTQYLNKREVNSRAIFEVVSRWAGKEDARVRLWSVRVRFVVDKVALVQVFFLGTSGFPCQYHSATASSTQYCYRNEKWPSMGNFETHISFVNRGGTLDREWL
jgi:hypothetical protein